MKYYKFHRESNKFDDILKDKNIKKYSDIVTVWYQYCSIGIEDHLNDKIASYIVLKYGDSLIDELTKDYSPLPMIDYIPKKR